MVRLTIPMVFAIISMMLLGLVDTFFISMLGTTELAAASFVMPIYFLTMNMALGIGMGLGSVNSRLIGENKTVDAARFITHTQVFTIIFAVVVAVAIYSLTDVLFPAMGADEQVVPHIKAYMHIILLGTPMIMLTMTGNNALRSTGNIKASAILSTLFSLLNLILDPLFIFGLGPVPALGIGGAAVATVLAATISCCCSLLVLGFHERLIDLSLPRIGKLLENWRRLLTIAVPAMAANMMTPLSAAIMTAMIARFGAEAVAGFGVGARIEALSLLIVFAMSSTLPMFIGVNIGAEKGERAFHALKSCLRFTLILQACIYLVLFFLSPFIASIFSDNVQVVKVIETFLLILPLSYGAHGIVILVMVSLNVLQRPRTALLIVIIRLVCLYLPLAYVCSIFYGIQGLFIGAGLGNVIAGVIAYRMMMAICKKQGLMPKTPA